MRVLKLCVYLSILTSIAFGQIFINEIDYTTNYGNYNIESDTSEFIELAGNAGTYSNVTVELIDGYYDYVYSTIELGDVVLSDEGDGYGFYVIGKAAVENVDIIPVNFSIQNGPDAVALYIDSICVDAVSYEGDMTDKYGNLMENAGEDLFINGYVLSLSRIGGDNSPWIVNTATPGFVNADSNTNVPPFSDAGFDQEPNMGALVTLNGSGSFDVDGNIVSFNWEQISGPEVTIIDADSSIATFVAPEISIGSTIDFSFLLTTADDSGATSADETVASVHGIEPITIADARTRIGQTVSVTGIVNSVDFGGPSLGNLYHLQDSTAGIMVLRGGIPEGISLGHRMTITGAISRYHGMIEIYAKYSSWVYVNSRGNTVPEPQLISLSELASNGEEYESELIRINGISITDGGDPWPSSYGDANTLISDNSGNTGIMRIDKDTEIDGSSEPPWPQHIIGVGSEYDGTYQIIPRMLSDFISYKPTFFNLLAPIGDSVVTSLTPEFLWAASSDPDQSNTMLTNNAVRAISSYQFYLGTDVDLSDVIPVEVIDTSYTPIVNLIENQLYFWTVFVSDDSGNVTFGDTSTFWTNAEKEAPALFTLLSPENNATGLSQTPTFSWEASSDPDPFDTTTYTFQIAHDSTFTNLAYIVKTIADVGHEVSQPLLIDKEYWWRVIATGSDSLTSESEIFMFTVGYVSITEELALPTEYTLHQNYPNPFNPSTTLRYGLPEDAKVSLIIYDIRGNVVRTIDSGNQVTGWYEHVWNGMDNSGQPVSTGLYLTRLQAGSYTKTIKMVFLK